jgi:hypothetical protein
MFLQNYKARFALHVGRHIQIPGVGKSNGIAFPVAKLLSTFSFLWPISNQRYPAIFARSRFSSPTTTAATLLVVQGLVYLPRVSDFSDVQYQVNTQWIYDFIVLHDKFLIYGSSGVEQSGLCLIPFPKRI